MLSNLPKGCLAAKITGFCIAVIDGKAEANVTMCGRASAHSQHLWGILSDSTARS